MSSDEVAIVEESPLSTHLNINVNVDMIEQGSSPDNCGICAETPPDIVPYVVTDNWIGTTNTLVFPLSQHDESVPQVVVDESIKENIAKFEGSSLDIDFFAVDLASANLHLLGTFINLASKAYLMSIQDPIFSSFKFGNVISMQPILVFEDLDETFPLRQRFISSLNHFGAYPFVESLSRRTGPMVLKEHWTPSSLVVKALQECGVSFVCYSVYGSKVPVGLIGENSNLVYILSKSPPERSFFDIAVSVPNPAIVCASFSSIPKGLPNIKLYPYFGYLFGGNAGGFSFSLENTLDFKWYTLLHHHLLACSKFDWSIPTTKGALCQKKASLENLYSRLCSSPLQKGSYQMEIQYYHSGLRDAITNFSSLSLHNSNSLQKWLESFVELRSTSFSHHSIVYEVNMKKEMSFQ